MKNIEMKAKVDNIYDITKKVKDLSNTPVVVIHQCDIFFNLPITQTNIGGRFKLRQFEDGTGELIFYQRPNIKGPKLSVFSKVELNVEKSKEIKQILTMANGVLGIVKKIRHLYMIDKTRIHIDYVLDLGHFIEIEILLDDHEDLDMGKEIAEKLIKDLGISEESLLSGAYFDMMKQ